MSRLCRLKTKTHGEDGQWAYAEIINLRAELERFEVCVLQIRKALTGDIHSTDDLLEVIGKLIRQRDELLVAIDLAEPVMEAYAGPTRLANFNAAIARVKGE